MNRILPNYRLAGWLILLGCGILVLTLGDRRLFFLARNTAILTVAVAAICLPLGTACALLLVRTNLPGRHVVKAFGIGLLTLPLYIQSAAWDAGFGRLGWYSMLQESLADPWLNGWLAVIWIHSVAAFPWVVFFIAVMAELGEPDLEESALLDGSTRQVFLHVTLRRAVPGITLATLWILVATAGEMTVTDLFSIRTLAEELYTSHAFGDGLFSQMGMVPAILGTLVLTTLTAIVFSRLAQQPIHLPTREPWTVNLGRWKWPLAIATSLLLLLLFAVPVGNLVYKTGLVVENIDGIRVRSWSLPKFIRHMIPLPYSFLDAAVWRLRRELLWTSIIGMGTATLSVAIAAPLAWLARRGGIRALPSLLISALSLSMSGPLVGFLVIQMQTASDSSIAVWLFDRTILAPVIAITWRCLPVTIVICWSAFSTISRSLDDAAAIDGAGPYRRFWYVGVAMRRPALVLAWFATFVIATGDLSTSILTLPPGIMTVPVRVFGLLHYGVDDQVAAICLTNLAGFLLLSMIIVRIFRTWARRSTRPRRHGNVPSSAHDE